MADNEDNKEVTPGRGADWEVVQLTASTYAAAPNAQQIRPDDSSKGTESPDPLFMSGHFVFPPRENEDVPNEPERTEILEEIADEKVSEVSKLIKSDDTSKGTEFFEVGSTLSAPVVEHEDHNTDNSPPKESKSNEDDGSSIPYTCWLKRHAQSLYRHAKETNTFWSIFVAAALTGIVILGKRWHRVNDEKMNKLTSPVNRFKGILNGGRQSSQLP